MRIFLILVMLIQLSGCTLFGETAGATLAGNLGSELIKYQFDDKDKDEKEKQPEK